MNLLLAFLIAIFIAIAYYVIKRMSGGFGQSASATSASTRISSLTSKLPSLKTIVVVLLVIAIIGAAIFLIMNQKSKVVDYQEVRTPESFDGDSNKGYGYSRINGGDFLVIDGLLGEGELAVDKTVRITNTAINWEYPKFTFSIRGIEGEKGEVITVDVLLESMNGSCPFSFTIGPSAGIIKVEFGVGKDDYIFVRVDNSPIPIGEKRFDSSVSFDLIVDITSNRPEESGTPGYFIPSFCITEATFG